MQILTNTGGIAQTNAWLIADEEARQAVLFDAPDHTVAPLLDEVERRGWDLIGLWLTHGHFDHLADHAVVKARFPGARILIHKLDEAKLTNPGAFTMGLPVEIPPGTADGYVDEGTRLAIGGLVVEVMATPGHSPGHVCYYLAKEKVLVGGDLIIMNAIGRTDFPDCSPRAMEKSLRRVMTLPDDVTLLPGHGGVSTIGEERETNAYVQMALEEG